MPELKNQELASVAMYTAALRIRRLARAWVRYCRARRGNVAVTFAIAAIPLLAFIGVAIDYSRANAMKVQLQAALDSTALMVSKNAATMSSDQLESTARKYFLSLFTNQQAKNITFNVSYSTSGGSHVAVDASADMPTEFVSILGMDKITVTSSATAKWGAVRLRVALVLDNTGSMAWSGKMTALKTATKNLIDQLHSAATVNGDVYVSIIPFSKDVNVGASNYNESWIDWTEWNQDNRYCSGWQWGNYCFGQWVTAPHSTWNGCIMDRGNISGPSSQNYDQKVTAPVSGVTASYYPAEQYNYCPLSMMGLSYDWTSMKSLVDQMYPNGSTNQPIGLVWGWQTLVGGGPFTAPAMDSYYTYKQVIILLSDGLNTQDRWYGDGSHTSSQVDRRMYDAGNAGAGTCANIKAAGITIYAVQVNTGGDPTSTLLQNCASAPENFFLLTSANQIITTFNTIGTSLTKLRIAQ
jgi:Flp pilus assembly protein TadG